MRWIWRYLRQDGRDLGCVGGISDSFEAHRVGYGMEARRVGWGHRRLVGVSGGIGVSRASWRNIRQVGSF